MSFQEAAVAIGLLTPLVLGILAFIEKFVHKKKEPEAGQPSVVQGMTVAPNSYADQLIIELQRELRESKEDIRILEARLNERNQNGRE
jgi:hypothetical protein